MSVFSSYATSTGAAGEVEEPLRRMLRIIQGDIASQGVYAKTRWFAHYQ